MCNCNNCTWQNSALEIISRSGNSARLSNRGTVSAAWRDYYAARRSSGCGCANNRCGNCCGRCGGCR